VNDRLLTVEEAAERLGTRPRFVRRLIAERRIGFVRLGERKGCPVRIAEGDLVVFVASGRVEPLSAAGVRRAVRRAVA
jgi:excisionase family DNA binding protein